MPGVPDGHAPSPVPVPTGPRFTMPRWVLPAVIVFWLGYLASILVLHLWDRLDNLALILVVSLFLTFAIEPGVNKLEARGARRGRATLLLMLGVIAVVLAFLGAVGTLIGSQIAELLSNSERYINQTVDFLNGNFRTQIDPEQVLVQFEDPDGAVQRFIRSQQNRVLELSATAVAVLFQGFTVLLFTYYMIADGPRLRRSICSRLRPENQYKVLATWELAITKTGGYLYSRALLSIVSALFHWIVFQAIGLPAPIALALWVGFVSQFLPVVGTYLAGVLPVLIAFLDSPVKALIVLAAIVVYQQIENYLLSPRITARTMEMHPALAFGAAIGGAYVLGAVGAILALPAVAMLQAILSGWGHRHEVVESPLTRLAVDVKRPPIEEPTPPAFPGETGLPPIR